MAKRPAKNATTSPYSIKIFLSSSWEKTRPEADLPSDYELTESILRCIKKLGYLDVVDPKRHEPSPVREKIQRGIDEADVVLCILTKRLKGVSVTGKESYLPSTYVLSEAAFALGRYQNYEGRKRVVAFYEEGVDLDQLGLFGEQGMDLVPFSRKAFDKSQGQFRDYLQDLPKKLRSGFATSQAMLLVPPYRQLYVRKHARVYRRGWGMVRMHCQALILDAKQLAASGGILHKVRTQRACFPDFKTMCETHIRNRAAQPFFSCVITSVNGRKVKEPPIVSLASRTEKEMRFQLQMPGSLAIRDNDQVDYQYAWGLPDAFARNAEDLSLEEVDQVDLRSSHGPIREAELYLEVEREARGMRRASPFSKEPYIQISARLDTDGPFSEPLPVMERDESLFYLAYKWTGREFSGTVRMSWRPMSREHWLKRETHTPMGDDV